MNSPGARAAFELSLDAGIHRACCDGHLQTIFSRDRVFITEAQIARRAQRAFDADAEAHWQLMRQSQ